MMRSNSSRIGPADLHARAVIEQHIKLDNVVDGFAAHHRMHAAGIIADHAAQRVVAMCRRIGCEGQMMFFRRVPQVVEHACPARPARFFSPGPVRECG